MAPASKIGRMMGGAAVDEPAEEEAEMADDEKASAATDAGLALKSALAGGDGAAIVEAFKALSSLVGS